MYTARLVSKLVLIGTLTLAGAVRAADVVEVGPDVDMTPPSDDEQVPVADEVVMGPEAPEDDYEDPESAAELPLDDEALLQDEFQRFKDLMSNGSIDAADNVAKRIVELAIRTSGPRSPETARALTNLGIVQQRNEQYEASIQNFQGAVDILEDSFDRLDSQLVNPLKGLGAAQISAGRAEEALQTYGRAVHITHVNEGPHNMDQVEILESMAETNLRLGLIDDALRNHELIYSLNERYYRSNMLALVPSLMRRAEWQNRTGYFNDERTTYRRVIRILETRKGKNDLSLIEPLVRLGNSTLNIETSDSLGNPPAAAYNGEIYFKRAVRIAEANDDGNWAIVANTKLALGDYFTQQQSSPSARRVYRDVWELLSSDEIRLEHRERTLGQPNLLRAGNPAEFAGNARPEDVIASDVDLREGTVSIRYTITSRGRVGSLELVEHRPPEFDGVLRDVQRQLRSRMYRPRFADGQPVDTGNQQFTHRFYYRQDDLETLRRENAAE